MSPIVEWAQPKVNLTLRVLGRRLDGYHELDSLVVFARDLADVVTLIPGASRLISTTGPFAGSIAGANLVSVTLDRIAQLAPGLMLGAVDLQKNLPVAAGIGGGSADAAAVMRAVMRANGSAADGFDWTAIAGSLGADIPVCLGSTAQRMRGIGDILKGVDRLPELAAVLVNPQVAVPHDKTAQVFRRLAAAAGGPMAEVGVSPCHFETRADLLAHVRAIGNDLLVPARAVVPAIDTVLAVIAASDRCELAQLSGGGPTCRGDGAWCYSPDHC